jgi:hypothetical protein
MKKSNKSIIIKKKDKNDVVKVYELPNNDYDSVLNRICLLDTQIYSKILDI